MPIPPAERASRLRRALNSLLDDYRHTLEDLLPLRQLLKGSIYELKTRCGKPSCHCAAQDGPLHATTVLSWSQAGRTRLCSVPEQEHARFCRLTENYRRLRQDRATLVKLHRRMLLTIDGLEQALRLPPPQPAARRRKK
jgi:hypothetical protein